MYGQRNKLSYRSALEKLFVLQGCLDYERN
jgi:hypothetical protein